jgi:glycosyltransferase involved in cell wall biosynthesis
MKHNKVLFIGLVWPEPTSSAAGTRIIQLINLFKTNGDEVHFASAASMGEYSFDLKNIDVKTHQIELNSSAFDELVKQINPTVVVFDRFMIEEQYGWRIQQECPDALRILDTEDLHFLRQARQQAVKDHQLVGEINLFNEVAKREIAAILRCDLSLIISKTEMDILQQQFKIDPSLLYYLPFLEKEITPSLSHNWKNFEEREGFVFIGNFLHEPNWKTVLHIKNEVWPLLRKKLPQATMNIYGAYTSTKVLQLNNPAEKFYIHGRADDARKTIAKHKILLAPILFGAGAKGKFIDAMQTGTPSATTTVGAESMTGKLDWCGFIEDDLTLFIDKAKELYQDQQIWLQAQQNGIAIINEIYSKNKYEKAFINHIDQLITSLQTHRQQNFIGQILNHHTLQSTKYLSLWIEEKNKINSNIKNAF